MKKICVVTGGGSGMGLEAARLVGKDHKIILIGRTVAKLEKAVEQLKADGIDAETYPADISDRESVKQLADYVKQQGHLKVVIHSAGVSPHMAEAGTIFTINALGTIYINEELAEIMDGGCILNVASMAAYLLPEAHVPYPVYQLALTDPTAFRAAMDQVLVRVPEEMKTGSAYTISKNFVKWYTERMAMRYGKKGIRVVSISPGTFRTPMGEVEGQQAETMALNGALGRMGEPEEIARMMAFMVSDDASYLTGSDILYDGGAIAAVKIQAEQKINQ